MKQDPTGHSSYDGAQNKNIGLTWYLQRFQLSENKRSRPKAEQRIAIKLSNIQRKCKQKNLYQQSV